MKLGARTFGLFRFAVATASIAVPAAAQLPLDDGTTVNSETLAGDQNAPSVGVADDGRVKVAWAEITAQDVRMRNFAADGTPFSAFELAQADFAEFDPFLSVNGSGDWIAAWGSNQVQDGGLDLYGRRTSNNGSTLGSEFQVQSTNLVDVQLPPRLSRADDDSWVAIWVDADLPGELNYRKFGADGTPTAGDQQANETNDPDLTDFEVAAAPDGTFLVVWQAGPSPDEEVLARCFDAGGVAVGPEFPVPAEGNTRNLSPQVGVDGRGFWVVAWLAGGDIEWRRIGPDCEPIGGDQEAIADASVDNVTLDVARDGAMLFAWNSTVHDADDGVVALELDRTGRALGESFPVNLIESGAQYLPDAGIGDRLFAIVWQDQEGTSGGDDDILLRRYLRRSVFADDFEGGDELYWSSIER